MAATTWQPENSMQSAAPNDSVSYRSAAERKPYALRTAAPVRGSGKQTDSSQVEDALFTRGIKASYGHPSSLRENSVEAERYLADEDAALHQRKEEEVGLLRQMAPPTRQKSVPPAANTNIEHQLQSEQFALERQLQKMELERDFLLRKNPKDSGSEPRYAQLNHRIGKTTNDLKRVDEELREVRRLEGRPSDL